MGRVGAGEAARDANVPAVSTEKISQESIFLFHGTVGYGGGGGQWCLLRKHVSPLGECPACQMSSPGPFQRKAFIGECGVKEAAVMTGADRSVTEVEIIRRRSRAPLTTQVHQCSA